jgi:cysteine dioxygenase
MKILKGSLTETRYAWPTVDLNNSEDRPLQTISEKTYQADQVTYMSDKLGLHRISNPDNENYAVSLHCRCMYLYIVSIANVESVHAT